jgi:thiol-disulfide isomerase/thioredoxin
MRPVPFWIFSLSLILGCTGEPPPSADESSSHWQALPGNPMAKGRNALQPGERIPALAQIGWLNGPPPGDGESKPRLIVIDVWGQWCSEVPKAICGLKQLHEEFGPKGVEFVSLTTESRTVVEQFATKHSIPWASGYRAPLEMINALGALNANISTPGYEVRPILYLVDSLGQVVWSDNNQRMEHGDQDKAVLLTSLRSALENQLEKRDSGPVKPSDLPKAT